MTWEQDEFDFSDNSGDIEREEALYLYNVGAKFLRSMLNMCQPGDSLYKSTQTVLTHNFLRERLNIDYRPYTGEVKWHPTGRIDKAGRWRHVNMRQWFKDIHKTRLPVDLDFYTFELLRYEYDKGYMSGSEYLNNVRRKVAYENNLTRPTQ